MKCRLNWSLSLYLRQGPNERIALLPGGQLTLALGVQNGGQPAHTVQDPQSRPREHVMLLIGQENRRFSLTAFSMVQGALVRKL